MNGIGRLGRVYAEVAEARKLGQEKKGIKEDVLKGDPGFSVSPPSTRFLLKEVGVGLNRSPARGPVGIGLMTRESLAGKNEMSP